MIPDCDGRSDGQTVRQTESIIANTALCIARAMLTRCKNPTVNNAGVKFTRYKTWGCLD